MDLSVKASPMNCKRKEKMLAYHPHHPSCETLGLYSEGTQ